MRILSSATLSLAALVSAAFGQINDEAPNDPVASAFKPSVLVKATPVVGDVNWSLKLQETWADVRTLGVEFDGTNYWVTSATDYTKCVLYKMDAAGAILATYDQPSTSWGSWGWRDLAWDGQYLYAGDDVTKPGYITQIDPTNGQPTGTYYGPVMSGTTLLTCRALAYDSKADLFYTANWGSEIFSVDRNSNVNIVYGQTGLSTYGMAMEESDPLHPMLWLWAYDGASPNNPITAYEWDPVTANFTGHSFATDPLLTGGICGGACAYPVGGGKWELCGMSQVPGYLGDLHGYVIDDPPALTVNIDKVQALYGGLATFSLDATTANANRWFVMFGTASGNSPGFSLPGGGALVPINQDIVTSLLLNVGWGIGQLNSSGQANLLLPLPPYPPQTFDIPLNFAYALQGTPHWDFASNAVEIEYEGYIQPAIYQYDDGLSETAIGLTNGGDMCWMQVFEAGPGDTITSISTSFGDPNNPGLCPPAGTPVTFAIWDDPTNDGDPFDGVLLNGVTGLVQNPDTATVNTYTFTVPVPVTGKFIVGCVLNHIAGQYPGPLDETSLYEGQAWFAGSTTGVFDYNVLGNNDVPPAEMSSIEFPGYWILRAQ